jgi:hypothetical protein
MLASWADRPAACLPSPVLRPWGGPAASAHDQEVAKHSADPAMRATMVRMSRPEFTQPFTSAAEAAPSDVASW